MKDQNGVIQTDALVDCGNALSQLAEVASSEEALNHLSQATEAYKTALSRTEDTTVVHGHDDPRLLFYTCNQDSSLSLQ